MSTYQTDECGGIVTRDGEQDACGKPAVAVIDSPEYGAWAACAYHAHRYGGGHVVPLTQLLDTARADERARMVAPR